MRSVRRLIVSLSIVLLLSLLSSSANAEPRVWTGLTKSFSKAAGVDPQLPGNYDVITDNVAFSRNSTGGIINVYAETFYVDSSPADTLWATDLNNPGVTISATNWQSLVFDAWVEAYGGRFAAGANVVPDGAPRDAVVYLITDDVFLDLRFTAWGVGFGGGGSFSYLRAEVPEPAAAALFVLGIVGLAAGQRRRRNP